MFNYSNVPPGMPPGISGPPLTSQPPASHVAESERKSIELLARIQASHHVRDAWRAGVRAGVLVSGVVLIWAFVLFRLIDALLN